MSITKIVAGLTIVLYFGLLGFLYLNLNAGKAYPNKPITIIVHSKPGSAIDLLSRKVAELARKYSKEPFVVENRPGTQGVVAMQYVMDKKPDGYTLLGVTKSFISTLIVNKSEVSMSDFLFIANMVSDPEALITNKKSGIETIEDIIEQANSTGDKQVWIGPGTGSRDHLMAMKSWEEFGINAEWVDYKSAPQSILAMLRNEAPVYVGNPSDILGKRELRIVAIAANERLVKLPEVPTFKESGYALNESMWRGFAFKNGTPKTAIDYVSDVFLKISEDPEWLTYCTEIYSFSDYKNPEDFSQIIDFETNETISYLDKASLLNTYVRKGKLPLWLVGILIAGIVFFLQLIVFRFNFSAFTNNIILSDIFIWVAGFFFYQTTLFDIPEGLNITSPALIPRIWAVALFVIAIWDIVNEMGGGKTVKKRGNLKALLKILLALFVYFLAIPQIGYFVSTPIFLIVGMYIMDYRNWPIMIINAFGFVLFSYLVFDQLLKIDLPMGNIF
jgi:tripartite-type tricarboxylate transporter receptor subunit TctC